MESFNFTKISYALKLCLCVLNTRSISTLSTAVADNVTGPAFNPLNATNDESKCMYCIGPLIISVLRSKT